MVYTFIVINITKWDIKVIFTDSIHYSEMFYSEKYHLMWHISKLVKNITKLDIKVIFTESNHWSEMVYNNKYLELWHISNIYWEYPLERNGLS